VCACYDNENHRVCIFSNSRCRLIHTKGEKFRLLGFENCHSKHIASRDIKAQKLEPRLRSFIVSLIFLWLTRHADFILWHACRPIKARDVRCPVRSLWDGEPGWEADMAESLLSMWARASNVDAYTLSPE
jgi:hypothetical protein